MVKTCGEIRLRSTKNNLIYHSWLFKKIYELCERIGELISPRTIGVASKHIHKSVGKFMKKILSFIIVISCLLLTAHGTSSVSDVLEVAPDTNAEVSSGYFSKPESTTDFRSILAANSIQCPPASSLILSGNQFFASPFPPYAVLRRHAGTLEKTQWNICAELKFVPNDIVQAHYYIFALRRILI